MMNMPAAHAAPAQSAAANAAKAPNAANTGLPPPAANAAPSADAAKDANTAASAQASAQAGGATAAVLDAAATAVPGPFGAILGALADAADADDGKANAQDGGADAAAAAAAVATMLPAMGKLPPAATPGAGPASAAAIGAALASAANTASATDALLRQRLQASALAAHDNAVQAGPAPGADLLDARAAMLAAAARPLPGAGVQPATTVQPGAGRPTASAALSAALNALQGGQPADSSAAPVGAKDSASLLADSQRQPGDTNGLPGFRSVLANTAAGQSSDALQLSGSPEQWQQPLRAALGDRLQLQLARNDERAVIRLEPPNMGSVEISVRHSGGALQVNIAASHNEVLRQLNAIGDAVRQDLSQRQLGEVAVTVSSSNARSLADGGQQQRQQDAQQQREQQRQPGRALDGDAAGTTTFAMQGERE